MFVSVYKLLEEETFVRIGARVMTAHMCCMFLHDATRLDTMCESHAFFFLIAQDSTKSPIKYQHTYLRIVSLPSSAWEGRYDGRT